MARNKTVVYRDWMNKENTNVKQPSQELVDILDSSGIRRIVCGHRPHGDAGVVIRSSCGRLTIVTLDTSYAANVVDKSGERIVPKGDAHDNRGDSVYELLLTRTSDNTYSASLSGITADGVELVCNPDEPPVGTTFKDRWVVKGERADDGRVLISKLDGHVVTNRWIEKSAL